MVTEERMKQLFTLANPIPDPARIEVDPATDLEELHKNWGGTTRPGASIRRPTMTLSRRRPTLVGGLAFALAVVVAIVALTRDNAEDVVANGSLVSADFVGTWTVPMEGISSLFLHIDGNGRYALSTSFGAFEEQTIETGDWSFDGDEFVFTTDDGVTSGCAGTVGRYTARRVDEERIRFTAAAPDPCPDRQHGMALGALRAYPLDPELSDG